jgi:hypothetical protein
MDDYEMSANKFSRLVCRTRHRISVGARHARFGAFAYIGQDFWENLLRCSSEMKLADGMQAGVFKNC